MKSFISTFIPKTLLVLSSFALIAGLVGTVQANAGTVLSAAVTATQDAQPEYPQSALRRQASGYVLVRFDVSSNGKARNVRVIDSDPTRIFDSAAIRAVRRSEFAITDGSSEAKDVERLYRFNHEANQARQTLSMN